MAKKKAKNKNNRKRNNGPARMPETSAEPLDQSEIATWLDTFSRLAGEVVDEDEGISHLVVPEDYRGSADKILSLIEKRQRRGDTGPEAEGLAPHRLIMRLEEAGVSGLIEAAMASTAMGFDLQFSLLDRLTASNTAGGPLADTEGLRQVGHLLQDLTELLPGEVPEFLAQRFWDLEANHREILLRLLHRRAGEQVVPFLDLVAGREAAVDLQLVVQAVEIASDPAAALLLRLEDESSDRQVQKAVSKGLYSLRSRGVKAAERDTAAVADTPSPLHYEEQVETRAFISGIDWQGQRLVLIAGLPGARGYAVAQALVDDLRGVREFSVWKMSRADLREMVTRAQQRRALLLCEVPVDHAWFVLEEAFQAVRPQGIDPAREFLQWRSSESWPKPDVESYRHPVCDLVPAADPAAGEPSGADWSRLLATDPLSGWTLGPEEAVKAWRELKDSVESAIIVPGAIQQERQQNAFQGVVTARFDTEACRRFGRRLEETSYLLQLSEKREEAALALTAARMIRELEDRVWDHPLIAALVQRDLDLVERREKEAREKDVSLAQPPRPGGAL